MTENIIVINKKVFRILILLKLIEESFFTGAASAIASIGSASSTETLAIESCAVAIPENSKTAPM